VATLNLGTTVDDTLTLVGGTDTPFIIGDTAPLTKYIVSGTIYEDSQAGKVIVGGTILEEVAATEEAVTANGTPSAPVTTASGAIVLIHDVTGAVTLQQITSSGVVVIAGGVVITDVNGTESWTDGDSGLVITGTGFV